MGFFIFRMEGSIMETGRRIKCMVSEGCIINLGNWLMKEIGNQISSTGMVNYSTKIL